MQKKMNIFGVTYTESEKEEIFRALKRASKEGGIYNTIKETCKGLKSLLTLPRDPSRLHNFLIERLWYPTKNKYSIAGYKTGELIASLSVLKFADILNNSESKILKESSILLLRREIEYIRNEIMLTNYTYSSESLAKIKEVLLKYCDELDKKTVFSLKTKLGI